MGGYGAPVVAAIAKGGGVIVAGAGAAGAASKPGKDEEKNDPETPENDDKEGD